MKTFVYYHGNSVDGFAAAAAFHSAVIQNSGNVDRCEYIRTAYHDYKETPIPGYLTTTNGDRAIFIDFCPPASVIEYLIQAGVSVMILDHHKTAFDIISTLPQELILKKKKFYFLIVEKFSGASLVKSLSTILHNPWIYRNEGIVFEEKHPVLGTFLTNTTFHTKLDRKKLDDLYKTIEAYANHITDSPYYQNSIFLNAYFRKHNVVQGDSSQFILSCLKTGLESMINEGRLIYETQYANVEHSYMFAYKQTVTTHSGKTIRVIIANPTNGSATLLSDVCDNKAAEFKNVIAVALSPHLHPTSKGRTSIGFRSRGVPCVDVAEKFGGGGHPNAARCEFNPEYPVTTGMIIQAIIEEIIRTC